MYLLSWQNYEKIIIYAYFFCCFFLLPIIFFFYDKKKPLFRELEQGLCAISRYPG